MTRTNRQTAAPVKPLSGIIWELGRAYYAYVGLLERVLVEEKLDKVLRPGMGLVMFALYDQDNRTMSELAECSQLANSTLTGVLKRMEKNGLVKRQRDVLDGRSVRVTLTPLGRKLEKASRRIAAQMNKVSCQGLGSANLAACTGFLQGMTQAYRQADQRLAAKQSKRASSKSKN